MRKGNNNIFITNSYSLKFKSTIESSELSSKFNKAPVKENKFAEREKITENFFEYLMKENSTCANFEKVTEYYEKKINKNKIIYNQNLAIIANKKEEIKKIKLNIFNIIINSVILEDKYLDLYYEKMKEQIQKEIILVSHELESYKNTYKDTYKKNYLLNSKLENISKSEKIYDQQYEKYVNIREAALSNVKKQEGMLKTLKFYFEKIQETNKNLLDEKQKKLKHLNYEIHVLKSEEEKNQKNMKILNEKEAELNDYFQKKIEQNLISIKDIKSYTKNYVKDKVIINKIYETAKEKNIDNIINKYNKLNFENKNNSTLFSLKSKNLINLNFLLSSLNNEYDSVIKKIKNKKKEENEEAKNDKMNQNDNMEKINILKEKIKFNIKEKNKAFLNNFKLLINIIISSFNLITNINHSRQISAFSFEGIPYEKRDDLIQKHQNYFDMNFTNKTKINFEVDYANETFLKFLIFIIKELNFQIKSIISNVYQILYISLKEKKLAKRNTFIDFNSYNIIRKDSKKSENNSENKENFISDFNINEYEKIYLYELKIKRNQLEERKKFFQFEEKDLFKKKQNNSNRRNQADENTNMSSNKSNNMFSTLAKERSSDYISTSDFLQQYYKYYTKSMSISENENINYSANINLNKFNFIINYTNEFVSSRKEYEDKKFEKYKKILIKSKKIKEELEKKEIFKYLKKSQKIKNILKEQYSQDISTDSEKEEKHKKEEIALQMVTKKLAELKKPKKFILHYPDKEVSKVYERYDDIRALELNFLKNRGKYLIDSGFFSEYYFRLKKQFNENKAKSLSSKIRIRKPNKNNIQSVKHQNNFKKNISSSGSNYESIINEKKFNSVRNNYNINKNNLLKRMSKTRKSLYRNNSEILNINFVNN